LAFDALFVPDALREAVSDRAWLDAMLEAERSLARAEVRAGVISAEEAAAVEEATRADHDPAVLLAAGRAAGNPIEPLVRALRESAPSAHHGATSQDVLDTAAALVSRRALRLVLADVGGVAAECARLADEHRDTVMAGRTLLQQATPTTFGLKAAGWLVGVEQTRRELAAAQLPAQLGGAAGTLASLGDRGVEVAALYAEELGLDQAAVPWHAVRAPVLRLGAALAALDAVLEKVALDVLLLAQTEIAEVREPGGGASSTMPHKRNPTGSTLARACAVRGRNAAVALLRGDHEHERAAGAWHAEWGALADALAYTGGAAAALRRTLGGLEVDAQRMRANVVPEAVSEAEAFFPGEQREPEDYLGSAAAFIERALDLYRGD
jgi:3-carboxy-cis,cis-muconate cycloisomerase